MLRFGARDFGPGGGRGRCWGNGAGQAQRATTSRRLANNEQTNNVVERVFVGTAARSVIGWLANQTRSNKMAEALSPYTLRYCA